MTAVQDIIQEALQNSYSYQEYRDLVKKLLLENKSTGEDSSEEVYNFTVLNDKRMNRLDKTLKLQEQTILRLSKINKKQTWLLIVEGWCGDAAQNAPVINKMAMVNSAIDLRVVLRDKNIPLIDNFLTNGSRAIPKLILLDENNTVVSTWGARPTEATQMVADYKAKYGKIDAQFKQDLQVWYNKNKGVNLQEDVISLI